MSNYTKRFMECFIILPLIMTGIVQHLDLKHSGELHAGAKGLPAALNQDIYDHSGPGETKAYNDFFNKCRQYAPYRIYLSQFLGEREQLLEGFSAVEDAPEPVKAEINEWNWVYDDLASLLKKGPFILSKDDTAFNMGSYNPVYTIQADLPSVMLWIRMLAIQKWLQGSPDQAVTLLTNTIRLGNAVYKSVSISERELAFWKSGLEGIDLLTWNDPSAESDRLIAQSLAEINEDDWTFNGNRIEQLRYYLRNISGMQFRSNDEWIAVLSILSSACDKSRTGMSDVFAEAGMIPTRNVSYGRMGGLARKWTTAPAMRKRAERIPDSFYESDPLLSAETIKKFPRLVYLNYRYEDEQFNSRRNQWRTALQNQAKAVKAVYAARVWHDEHGTWPTAEQFAELNPERPSFDGYWRDEHGTWLEAEQFATLNPQNAPFEWHITSATEPLVKHFMSIHGIDEYLMPETLNRSYCIGYMDMPQIDYSRNLSGGYGYSYGVSGNLQIGRDGSTGTGVMGKGMGMMGMGMAQASHREIQEGTITVSVMLPHPPKEMPSVLFAPGRGGPSISYEITEIRKPPECDATVVYAIPRPEISATPSGLTAQVTAPHEAILNWASGIFKAFTPLVVSVTEVCPPPRSLDYEGSSLQFGMLPRNDIEPGSSLNPFGITREENLEQWTDPALGQPAVVVGLKFPKRSFWVTHPGPDGISDGPGLVYDPSNGIKSAGDIVQLAGMEY